MTGPAVVEERCRCCDLPSYSCGSSIENRMRIEEAQRRVLFLAEPSVVRAQYPGRCVDCSDPFRVGDPIRHDDLLGGWVAQLCCGEDPS